MLTKISVDNYALIDRLELEPSSGLTIITGETGAGKSILLGALGLALGSKTDTRGSLLHTEKKCVIECTFALNVSEYGALFESHDLDFYEETTFRREISPNGRSRSFINDTPVTQAVLLEIGEQLVDINSQQQTQALRKQEFQLGVIDAVAQTSATLSNYKTAYRESRSISRELTKLKEKSGSARTELDYKQFMLKELLDARLENLDEEAELASEIDQLSHAEQIRERGQMMMMALREGEENAISLLQKVAHDIGPLTSIGRAEGILARVRSVTEEVKDIASEIGNFSESGIEDPERLSELNARAADLQRLKLKHRVANLEELIAQRNLLDSEVSAFANLDQEVEKLEKALLKALKNAEALGNKLSKERSIAIPKLEQQVQSLLADVGMPYATIKVLHKTEAKLLTGNAGFDDIRLLFSANKGVPHAELSKVASGGELSRLMLSIKATIAAHTKLPTMIFDEIDTGISGDVANKVGALMQRLADTQQLVAITHLPQIAASGSKHYFVYKQANDTTTSHIRELNRDERVLELATMMQGNNPTETALSAAREMLERV